MTGRVIVARVHGPRDRVALLRAGLAARKRSVNEDRASRWAIVRAAVRAKTLTVGLAVSPDDLPATLPLDASAPTGDTP